MDISASVFWCFGNSRAPNLKELYVDKLVLGVDAYDVGKSRGSESIASLWGTFPRLLGVLMGEELGKAIGEDIPSRQTSFLSILRGRVKLISYEPANKGLLGVLSPRALLAMTPVEVCLPERWLFVALKESLLESLEKAALVGAPPALIARLLGCHFPSEHHQGLTRENLMAEVRT